MTEAEIRSSLNAPTAEERLANLEKLVKEQPETTPLLNGFSNNHIHTTFSFSPYSPTAAVWFARHAGLPMAGIMDHDSVGGGKEFRRAAKIVGIGSTCGFEARINMAGTPFESTKLNSPDQKGVAYMAFHSIREKYFDQTQEFLQPLRELRNERNRKMVRNIVRETGYELDFDRDVVPVSQFEFGGAITERHLLYALTGKMIPDGAEEERYTLLGKLKKELMPKVFIPADKELMKLAEAVDFAKQIDAILCYAYLGDVTNSPTGDKSAAKYEAGFLPELFETLRTNGIGSVTFMPSRNTTAQLERVMALCKDNGFMQISGEDVNSLGQSFICEKLGQPEYKHLVDAAWNLVKREE